MLSISAKSKSYSSYKGKNEHLDHCFLICSLFLFFDLFLRSPFYIYAHKGFEPKNLFCSALKWASNIIQM